MVDLTAIDGFDWDEGNARKSLDKHGIGQAEAEQVFLNKPLLLLDDVKHSLVEKRYYAFGRSNDGFPIHITFTLRNQNTLLRVISARPMNKGERSFYEEKC